MAVNGFQLPGLRFVSPAGGLKGFQQTSMSVRKRGGVPPFALTQFASKGDIAVSGAGLTLANASGTAQLATLAANVGRGSGKVYAEALASGGGDQGELGLGTAAAVAAVGQGATGGTATNTPYAVATRGESQPVRINGAAVLGISALAGSAGLICMAADFDLGLVWFRANSGWNTGITTHPLPDPATGQGGIPLSLLTGLATDGLYYLLAGVVDGQNSVVNVGPLPNAPSTFSMPVPPGFYPWQGV